MAYTIKVRPGANQMKDAPYVDPQMVAMQQSPDYLRMKAMADRGDLHARIPVLSDIYDLGQGALQGISHIPDLINQVMGNRSTPVSKAVASNPTPTMQPTAMPTQMPSATPAQIPSPTPTTKPLTTGQANDVLTKYYAQQGVGAPTPTSYPKPDAESMISKTFPEEPQTARAVAIQESSLNNRARNHIPEQGIDAIGLMQVNLPAHMNKVPGKTYDEKVENLMDPQINLNVARQIYNASHWQPWEAYTSGDYKKYLKK